MSGEFTIYLVIILSTFSTIFLFYQAQRARKIYIKSVLWVFGFLSVIVLIAAAYMFWYTHRPLPANEHRMLFEGIEYIREVRREPRPLVIHVVYVDLNAPGIEFLVTPSTPTNDHDQQARTTSQFLMEFDLQLAINGDSFDPWVAGDLPWDFYPHIGDPVNTRGFSASRGEIYDRASTPRRGIPTFYLSADNQASFHDPGGDYYNVISGLSMLVEDGVYLRQRRIVSSDLHPRTAVGLDAAEQTLIIVVVDGRQPNYSEGVALFELAEIMVEYGAHTALNLDGGGSTALVIDGENGRPEVLNSPIHSRIPGWERPIANHLGIYARRVDGE